MRVLLDVGCIHQTLHEASRSERAVEVQRRLRSSVSPEMVANVVLSMKSLKRAENMCYCSANRTEGKMEERRSGK